MTNRDNLASVGSVYDTVAEAYAAALPDTDFEPPEDMALIDGFADRVRAAAGRKVVDAGCGTGRMSVYLSDMGLDVTGVDLSPGMVRVARRLHPGMNFETGHLACLPLDDASTDGILAWYSIIHTSPADLPAVIGEFWRALRPGGLALIAFQAGTGHRIIERAYGHGVELRAELHPPNDVVLRFMEQGFEVHAQSVRPPRATEKHPQAILLAGKPSAAPPQ